MPTDLPVCDKSPIGASEQAHTSHRDKGRSTKSTRIWDGTWQDMPQVIIINVKANQRLGPASKTRRPTRMPKPTFQDMTCTSSTRKTKPPTSKSPRKPRTRPCKLWRNSSHERPKARTCKEDHEQNVRPARMSHACNDELRPPGKTSESRSRSPRSWQGQHTKYGSIGNLKKRASKSGKARDHKGTCQGLK